MQPSARDLRDQHLEMVVYGILPKELLRICHPNLTNLPADKCSGFSSQNTTKAREIYHVAGMLGMIISVATECCLSPKNVTFSEANTTPTKIHGTDRLYEPFADLHWLDAALTRVQAMASSHWSVGQLCVDKHI